MGDIDLIAKKSGLIGVSSSCGSFSLGGVGSTSYTDVTNLSVTVTTNGRPVMIWLGPAPSSGEDFSGGAFVIQVNGFLDQYMRVLRDATSIGHYNAIGPGTVNGWYHHPTPPIIDVVAAGTYTYKVQVRRNNTGTIRVTEQRLHVLQL